jgi:hypothetical protein
MSMIQRPAVNEVRECKILRGGGWTHAASGKTFKNVNPYTGLVLVTRRRVVEPGGRRRSGACCSGAFEGA